MSANDRLPVFATRGSLNMTRRRLCGARRSHKILRQKADGITVRFRAICEQLVMAKSKVREAMRLAYHLQAESKFQMGNYNQHIIENVKKNSATMKVKCEEEHVMGIRVVNYTLEEVGPDNFALTGLGSGYAKVMEVKNAFRDAAKLLVQVCSLEKSFIQFEAALEDTNRRLNATGQIMIPRLENTAAWIEEEMCELEREDFYRVKKLKNKKQALADALRYQCDCYFNDEEDHDGYDDDCLDPMLKHDDLSDDYQSYTNNQDDTSKNQDLLNGKSNTSTEEQESLIKTCLTHSSQVQRLKFDPTELDFDKTFTVPDTILYVTRTRNSKNGISACLSLIKEEESASAIEDNREESNLANTSASTNGESSKSTASIDEDGAKIICSSIAGDLLDHAENKVLPKE